MPSDPPRAGRGRAGPARTLAAIGLVAAALVCRTDVPTPSRIAATDNALELFAEGCGLVAAHGTAFALGDHLVATMAHIVVGATNIELRERGGAKHAATVVAIDTERDTAVLRAPTLDRARARLGALRAGERVAYFGYGAGHDEGALVTVDVVRPVVISSEDVYIKGDYARPGYQLQGPVTGGDSGAGIVSERGSLAALVWAASRGDDGGAFAVSVDVLADLLRAVARHVAAPPTACR